jgi:nitrogen fixation NifU-like protein
VYNELLLDHFRRPRNAGELPPPALSVSVSNPACGDTLGLSVRFEGDLAVEARYRATGCTASIAAGSALTELIVGRDALALRMLDAAAVEHALGGLPPPSRHAAALCEDALKALLRLRFYPPK